MNENIRPSRISNVRAEEAVLGKILTDGDAFRQIAGDLRADHFTLPHHKAIFEAVAWCCENSSGPSLSLLESRLPTDFEGVGAVEAVLLILIEKASDVTSATDFIDEIVDAWEARQPGGATLSTITPSKWKSKPLVKQRWAALGRIPFGDVTIASGNGGVGKTEIFTQLLIYVAVGLEDWLGCTIENGAVLFLCCEEPEHNIRDRIERICRHRNLDPYNLKNLHIVFPSLDETWLVQASKDGRLSKTPLLTRLEAWISRNRPVLVVIDSVAAVFDGDAISRRQVRAFIAMLRKIAHEHDTAIVLLDHPSVRGMSDGSGTANSVDWRNSVRSMLHLSDADKDDLDQRVLAVTKSNYGRTGEKVTLRWTGLTFTTAMTSEISPQRAAADRDMDDLFLRLLDKRNAQGRRVHASAAKGSAPGEFEADPDAGGTKAEAFRRAMERLFAVGKIRNIETGPPSKRRQHIERVME